MKKLSLLLMVSPILFFINCTHKSSLVPSPKAKLTVATEPTKPFSENIGKRTAEEMVAAGFKRYGIEKGILIFRMDGGVNGTENLYFDHWGWREGKYVQSESDIGTYDRKTKKIQFP